MPAPTMPMRITNFSPAIVAPRGAGATTRLVRRAEKCSLVLNLCCSELKPDAELPLTRIALAQQLPEGRRVQDPANARAAPGSASEWMIATMTSVVSTGIGRGIGLASAIAGIIFTWAAFIIVWGRPADAA